MMPAAAFSGKVALITGASGDIGVALVERFLALGCTVFATFQHHRSRLDQVQEAHARGPALHVLHCDVTDAASVESLLAAIAEHTPKLDLLINNAGVYKDNIFAQMPLDEFDLVIKTNLYGTFNVTKASLRLLRAAKSAAVINLSSVAGLAGSFGQANYSAAKAGIGGLTRTLANELTSKGIRVNAVAPGLIDSSMVKSVPRNIVRQALSMIPAKRLGTVEEVTNVIEFLAGDGASYIVGQTIVVDGGLVLR